MTAKDAGGVTIKETKLGDAAACPLLRDIDGDKTSLGEVLDTMQTSIEAAAGGAGSVLADGDILVGNVSNIAVAVTMSGDATIVKTGAITIAAGAVDEAMLVVPSGDGLHAKRIAKATYSFAEHGGAVSTIGLGVTLPDNAVVVRTFYEVITTLTSNSANDAATISFDIPTDDVAGLVAATAISAGGNIWDAGYHEGIQDGTAAAFAVKTAAARELSVTIGVEAIDAAGIVDFFCEYVVTE
jgi:hypothetical protein